MIWKGFVGPAYEAQSPIFASERTINMYAEFAEVGGEKSKAALYSCPGMPSFATLGDTPGRGIFSEGGRLFVVFG